jgi:hypothetical protein
VLGFGRQVSFSLAGWLWADLLLGMFAIFLAANAVGAIVQNAQGTVDPQPVEIRVDVSASALLSDDERLIATEQRHITDEITAALGAQAPGRRVAIALVFGSHSRPAEGDRIATLGTALLKGGPFANATIRTYHEIVGIETPSSLALEVYLYR